MEINVTFNQINVNSMTQNAGIFNGETLAIGWHAPLKQNTSIGPTGFAIYIGPNISLLYDNDWIDTSILHSNTLNINGTSGQRKIAGNLHYPAAIPDDPGFS